MNISVGLILCIVSFLACLLAGARSLGLGISVLMLMGYFYGILRANFYDGFSHFIFDAGVIGLYIAAFGAEKTQFDMNASRTALQWTKRLAIWPVVLFLIPVNHYLVQLVGLRHIIFFLPFMVLGSRARPRDLDTLVVALAIMNSVAFGFAMWEYAIGLKPFFPVNAATEIMYRSGDIKTSAGKFYRLPSIFMSAHAYAGTMYLTLPFLLNMILSDKRAMVIRVAVGGATLLTVLGVFLAGPRLPVVQMALAMGLMVILPGLKFSTKSSLIACMLAIGIVCAHYIIADPRMQRFTSINDTDMVERRAAGSLYLSPVDSIVDHPIGVGLGGAAGSSMPSFLKDLAPKAVGAENEFTRIAVEQGFIGFVIWIAFLAALVFRTPVPPNIRWSIGAHAMRAVVIASWATAFVGTGILQSIPGSVLLLLQMGFMLRDDSLRGTNEKLAGQEIGRNPHTQPGSMLPGRVS